MSYYAGRSGCCGTSFRRGRHGKIRKRGGGGSTWKTTRCCPRRLVVAIRITGPVAAEALMFNVALILEAEVDRLETVTEDPTGGQRRSGQIRSLQRPGNRGSRPGRYRE